MIALSVLFILVMEHARPGMIVGAIGVLMIIGLLFFNRILDRFDMLFRVLSRLSGIALTWVLLTPLFYLIFGFGRLVLLISGNDPMNRRKATGIGSYWRPAAPDNKDNFQKQY